MEETNWLIRDTFSGLLSFIRVRQTKMPWKYFRKWLLEKWKADLLVVGHWIVLFPWVIWAVTAAVLIMVGEAMANVKEFLPNFLFVPSDYRDAQQEAAREANAYLRSKDHGDEDSSA